MSAEGARRVFVVGCPRSGTTLLQSLLAAHPEATSFTESHFLSAHFRSVGDRFLLARDPRPRVVEFLRENGLFEGDAAAALGRLEAELAGWPLVRHRLDGRAVAGTLLEILDEAALQRGAKWWVEKTPRHLHFLELVERSGAQRAHVVHIVRPPEPTIRSLHRVSQEWSHPYGLVECAQRWSKDVALSLQWVERPNHHLILYEDLVRDPEESMRRLSESVRISWRPSMLDDYREASRELIRDDEPWKQGASEAIVRAPGEDAEPLPDRAEKALRRELLDLAEGVARLAP